MLLVENSAAHRSQSPNELLISLRSDYEQAFLPEEFSNTYPESRLTDRSKEDVEQKQDSDDTWFAFDLDEHLHGNDTIQPIQNYIDPNGARMSAISEQFCDGPEKIYKSKDTEQQTYRHRHEANFPDHPRTELNRNNLCEVKPVIENDSDVDLVMYLGLFVFCIQISVHTLFQQLQANSELFQLLNNEN